MSIRRLAALAPGVVSALATVGGLVLFIRTPQDRVPPGLRLEDAVVFIVMQLSLGVVGAAIVLRHPANPIGWLLSAGGMVAALNYLAGGYATYGSLSGDPLPAADVAAWFFSWGSLAVSFWVGPTVFLFPDGWVPSRRASVGLLLAVSVTVLGLGVFAVWPGPLSGIRFVENPFGWHDGLGPLSALLPIVMVLAIPFFGLAFSSLRDRYRHASGVARQQLKWFIGGLGLFALVTVFAAPVTLQEMGGAAVDPSLRYLARLTSGVSFAVIPTVIGIAILRYHLYDIDLVINRTLVYGATTAVIAVAFFGGIVLLQSVLRPLTGGSEAAVAISTLASVALFQPLRSRIQTGVDRRFYRSRYDAARTVDDFSARLRDQVELEAVRADLLRTTCDTMQPAHASVWLRERAR